MQFQKALQTIVEFPGDVAQWARTIDDATFVRLMVVGAIVLTFAIARALR
jgi:hypothetical protein